MAQGLDGTIDQTGQGVRCAAAAGGGIECPRHDRGDRRALARTGGSRLNKLYRKDVGHDEIVAALTPLIERYATERETGKRFGDFVIRQGYVAPTTSGADFHANLGPDLAA
jgi:hypothetical protein